MISGRLGFVVRRGFQLQAGHQSKKRKKYHVYNSYRTAMGVAVRAILAPEDGASAPMWHLAAKRCAPSGTTSARGAHAVQYFPDLAGWRADSFRFLVLWFALN
jgi:hypothetical protein